ncbi:glycosyltransferase family 71 protein [Chaetomium strumarium]|uniref:Glycosyltransferase family 71 protein n=1 Tax=Chaetomium strumarium TaxID=1170767 RepID=A0AAJ0GPP2_9PEZI|nr:glycosyltransferase family 71 protein [Chaetomium strumarium]
MALRRIPRILILLAGITSILLITALYSHDFGASSWSRVVESFTHSDSVHGNPEAAEGFDLAHRLPSAESFRGRHLEKVLALPGLSISETRRTCNWTSDQKVNFMFGADQEWNVKERPSSEIDFRRRQWQDFVRNSPSYQDVASRFSGRGIVVLAGNGDTLMRTKVLLRALRRLNSTVPVEVHYYGDEMDDGKKQQLTDIYANTVFNDLASTDNVMHPGFHTNLINYQLKTAAIVNSRWAEILLLDSDNIPVIDPAELFDSPTYKEYRTVFWPDMARTRPPNPAWAITNTLCRMDEFELESGQLLVDKARFWHHVQLAAFMNNDRDRYYDGFLLGDKDTFRFAWHALKTRYGKPRRWLTSVGTVYEGRSYCGNSFAQHHPDDGRIAFLHGGTLKTMSRAVMRWNRDVRGGVFRYYKRAPNDQDPAAVNDIGILWIQNEQIPDLPKDNPAQWCTDMPDVEARELDEVLPGFEEVFRELGGYWPLDKDA